MPFWRIILTGCIINNGITKNNRSFHSNYLIKILLVYVSQCKVSKTTFCFCHQECICKEASSKIQMDAELILTSWRILPAKSSLYFFGVSNKFCLWFYKTIQHLLARSQSAAHVTLHGTAHVPWGIEILPGSRSRTVITESFLKAVDLEKRRFL